MGVTAQESAEFALYNAVLPVMVPVHKWHGRLRVAYFKFTQVGTGDANSTAELVHLPAGQVRVLGYMSKVYFAAMSSGRTMDVGFRAYVERDGTPVVEDEDYFASAVDVSSAGSATLDEAGTAASRAGLLDSRDGIDVFAKIEVGNIATGTIIEGYIVYVVD